MSRRKQKPIRRVQVPIAQLNAIVERTRTAPLPADEHATLKAAVDTLARLTEELETTTTTLERLRRLIFGPRTETTATVLGNGQPDPSDTPAPPADTAPSAGDAAAADPAHTPPRPGHGRNGAEKYPRAPRIAVTHDTLQHGDPCPQPDCTGRVYVQRQEPAVLVRVTGVAPLQAQVYTLERLRCGLCGTVFSAAAPAGIGEQKYDESAAAMIALLKYGCGLPFHRIQRLEQALAIPLPATTQWDVVAQAAPSLAPAFAELVHQAAQGTVLYNDDTTMCILTLTAAARAEALPPGAKAERTGVFTSGVVAETCNGPIALFKTGPCQAGEHLAEVLDQRHDPTTPIQMSDALARNTPGDHPTQAASGIPHYPEPSFIWSRASVSTPSHRFGRDRCRHKRIDPDRSKACRGVSLPPTGMVKDTGITGARHRSVGPSCRVSTRAIAFRHRAQGFGVRSHAGLAWGHAATLPATSHRWMFLQA
ncbi:transposase [uncultured Thiodictyon sp.]|uniref:IS66 family transposase n=1 Tax=uncultured Thiodictyon sp. TaxID=1846217 RepID=UPI0025E7D73E|nr:transposase [uncultured Thiodictyon sp.]